jgi:uncharacterized protein (TIGR00369 family)
MNDQPIQHFYNPDTAVCYGCGRNNAHGLHIQTFWDGTTGTARFTPQPQHTAFPGVVYGGLLASLIDCHSIGTAIAAMYDAEGRTPDTAQLNVTYLHPTPIEAELILSAQIAQLTPKKAVVLCSILVGEVETVRAETIAVRVGSRAGFATA